MNKKLNALILDQVKIRSSHKSISVRKIAEAILANKNSGWISEILDSDELNVYNSFFEKALVLEKIVLHSILADWWNLVLSKDDSHIEKEWKKKRLKLLEYNEIGWDEVVKKVKLDKVGKFLDRPVQTHRINRYQSVISKVVLPLVGKDYKKFVVLDAGASAGWGAMEAKNAGLNYDRWIAVDKKSPFRDLGWFLTCSVRVEEIISGKYKEYLKKPGLKGFGTDYIEADLENLVQIPDSSIDIYLAIYSLYQLEKVNKALSEAGRVLRSGGVFVATDNFFTENGITKAVSPGEGGDLSTIVSFKDNGILSPIKTVYKWFDSEFKKGKKV